MAKRAAIDWASIRADYEASGVSTRALARQHQVSERAIRKHATAESWLRSPLADPRPATATVLVPTVLAAAVDSEPKALAGHGRRIVGRLLDELDSVTAHVGEIEDAIINETADDPDGKRRDAMLRAVSLPARSAIIKNLASAVRTLAEISAPPGKKELAQEAAATAGIGSDWGDDLAPGTVN